MNFHRSSMPCNEGGAGNTHSTHWQLSVMFGMMMVGSQRALLCESSRCKVADKKAKGGGMSVRARPDI